MRISISPRVRLPLAPIADHARLVEASPRNLSRRDRSGRKNCDYEMAEHSPASGTDIRIFVVDDPPLMGTSIRPFLEGNSGFGVCGEARTSRETMLRVAHSRPDMILQDLMLPEGDGFSLVRKLHAWNPRVPILVISTHPDSLYAENCLRLGARGFVIARDAADELVSAIQEVMNGGIFVSDLVQQNLLSSLANRRPEMKLLQRLSVRELEVIRLIGTGCTMAGISDRLRINRKTTAAHRDRIKRKLGLSDNHELVKSAQEWFPSNVD